MLIRTPKHIFDFRAQKSSLAGDACVLLIDDHPSYRQAVAAALRTRGYSVLESSGFAEGLDLARSVQPDLVVLDAQVQGAGGIEASPQLKVLSDLSATWILLMTEDFEHLSALDEGTALSADALIARPERLEELIAWIDALIRIKRTEDQFHSERQFAQAVLDQISVGVIACDGDGNLTLFNRASIEYHGLPAKPIPPEEWSSYYALYKADGQTLMPKEQIPLWRALQGETVEKTELIIAPKNHPKRHVVASGQSIMDAAGRKLGAVVAFQDITEEKRIREELQRNEVRFRTLIENGLDGFVVLDPYGVVLYASPTVQRVLGYSVAEILGKDGMEIVHPDDQNYVRNRLQALVDDSTLILTSQYRIRHKDGAWRWLESSARNFLHHPDIQGIVTNFRDITERRRAETNLYNIAKGVSASTGELFFKSLAEHVGKTLESEFAFVAELRLEHSPPTAKTIASFCRGKLAPNMEYPLADTPCEQVLRHGSYDCTDQVARHFPRDPLLVKLRAQSYVGTLLSDSAGRPLGILAVIYSHPIENVPYIDSTLKIFAARAAAELERRRSEQELRRQANLLNLAQDAIVVRDLDNRVQYWNQGAVQLYGWSVEEARGQRVTELMYAGSEEFEKAMQRFGQQGKWTGEMSQLTKDGRKLTVSSRWTLIFDEEGRPQSILSFNTDMTEQRRLEAQFLRSQRMESIGTLASGIAHDLNNILAPVLMSCQLLRMRINESERERILTTVEESARRGAEIVRQVLTFARGVEGKRAPLEPRQLIQEMVRIVKETFPRTITVRSLLPANLYQVMADSTQLHQVLLNLFVNARDAMPEGGLLEVSAENIVIDDVAALSITDAVPGRYVVISVQDQGTGIPREILDKIFEPFFTTKPQSQGTGLGLSTVLGIVRSHGGFLKVYSEVERGTKFQVFLPSTETAAEAQSLIEEDALPEGAGQLILVVDDEPGVRDMAQRILAHQGYRVLAASDGTEALALYAEHRFALAAILTDMTMPRMDGIALIRAIRKLDPEIPIIASSGLSGEASLRLSSAALSEQSFDEFLEKPYTAENMLRTLHRVLAKPTNL